MTCTFFGHREVPEATRNKLRETLKDLIENQGADMFYVGNQGKFDRMAAVVLRELKADYPHIDYRIVLAYLPKKGEEFPGQTEFPAGIENTPKKYAIDFRNKWMLSKADMVITYITHDWGGAAKFAAMAKRKEKQIINLSGVEVEL